MIGMLISREPEAEVIFLVKLHAIIFTLVWYGHRSLWLAPITCTAMLCYTEPQQAPKEEGCGEGVSPPHCTVVDRHRRWTCSFKRLVNEKKMASPTARKRVTQISNDTVPFKRRLNDVIPTRDYVIWAWLLFWAASWTVYFMWFYVLFSHRRGWNWAVIQCYLNSTRLILLIYGGLDLE